MKATTAKILCFITALLLISSVLHIAFPVAVSSGAPNTHKLQSVQSKSEKHDHAVKQSYVFTSNTAAEAEDVEERIPALELVPFVYNLINQLSVPATKTVLASTGHFEPKPTATPLYIQHCTYLL